MSSSRNVQKETIADAKNKRIGIKVQGIYDREYRRQWTFQGGMTNE